MRIFEPVPRLHVTDAGRDLLGPDAELVALAALSGVPSGMVERLIRGVRGGVGWVDTVEQAMLDHFMTDAAYTPPATMYIGLSSTTPTEAAGNYTEPSGGSYARVSTAAADWAAASGTAPATKSTSTAKTFPTASADWVSAANLTHFGLSDASSAGNLLLFGALTTAKPVLNGDTASFASGALTYKLGDPTDSY